VRLLRLERHHCLCPPIALSATQRSDKGLLVPDLKPNCRRLPLVPEPTAVRFPIIAPPHLLSRSTGVALDGPATPVGCCRRNCRAEGRHIDCEDSHPIPTALSGCFGVEFMGRPDMRFAAYGPPRTVAKCATNLQESRLPNATVARTSRRCLGGMTRD